MALRIFEVPMIRKDRCWKWPRGGITSGYYRFCQVSYQY